MTTPENTRPSETNWTFEDWVRVGKELGEELGMMEQEKSRLASDLAWRFEGSEITAESLEYAYQDWITGSSPYSPHTVSLDGYDYIEWGNRRAKRHLKELRAFAEEKFADEPYNIDRFYNGMKSWVESAVIGPRNFEQYYTMWNEGKLEYSPHFIPLDEVNMQNRREQEAKLRAYYPNAEDWAFQLFFREGQMYGSLGNSKIIKQSFQEDEDEDNKLKSQCAQHTEDTTETVKSIRK